MDPGDDIIDVLYRCRETSGVPLDEDRPRSGSRSGTAVFSISPGAGLYSNTSPHTQPHTQYQGHSHLYNNNTPIQQHQHYSNTAPVVQHHYNNTTPTHNTQHHYSSGQHSNSYLGNTRREGKASPTTARWSSVGSCVGSCVGTARVPSTTPVLGRYNAAGGTGRIGYNNTPQVRRRASFTRSGSNPTSFEHRPSPLPRSASAFDQRTSSSHREYGHYHSENEGGNDGTFVDEQEPIYIPRSTLVDIIHRDDEFLVNRHRGEDLIELPSGARQRKTRIFDSDCRTSGDRSLGSSEGMELRHRRKGEEKGRKAKEEKEQEKVKEEVKGDMVSVINKVVGLLVMVWLAYRFSLYLLTLHDNELWFSEIQELEREISFRTEQGLYYSFFKQLTRAPSLSEGVKQLQSDNKTESVKTINIIHRFNVYQEIILAALYKIYTFRLPPIFFYTYSVFFLQGVFLSALYLTSWSLTGSWMSGVLTAVYVVINRFDVTRVNFTVPLREHFSLPFIFCQFVCVGRYLANKRPDSQTECIHLSTMFLTSLLFTLTWQFAQFVLLIQALTLFGLATLGLQDRDRVCRLLTVDLCVMLSVWYLQYYQTMVLNSLVVSLIPVAILSLQSQTDTDRAGVMKNFSLSLVRVFTAGLVTVCLNMVIKLWIDQTADSHIFKFLKNKLSRDTTDFETQLYLCNEAFKWLGWSTYSRLLSTTALPSYLLLSLLCIVACIHSLISRWKTISPETQVHSSSRANGVPPQLSSRSSSRAQLHQQREQAQEEEDTRNKEVQHNCGDLLRELADRPDLCFHIGQSLPLALLAAFALRMKCFWSPYICVLASVALSDPTIWSAIVTKVSGSPNLRVMNFTRHLVLVLVILLLTTRHLPSVQEEMEDLREFYDPDTVDLMQWIQQNSNPDDVFSGSMQLLAGVKLCTDRTLSNHPHFEDRELRERTKRIYQMYAKTGPEEVYSILREYNTSYIILEDSICLAHRERCSLPDIMDLTNGHIPDDGVVDPPDLVESSFPRFCIEVRYDTAEYRKYFRKVFENHTFRIYKLAIKAETKQ